MVSRDNPELQGWFDWEQGNWTWAEGTYSHLFEWGGGAGAFLRTYEYRGSGEHVDDWVALLRPWAGYWSSPPSDFVSWGFRTGALVPQDYYRFIKVHTTNGWSSTRQAPTGAQYSPSKWIKLDDNVLVVPVVIVDWRYAGWAANDRRERVRSMIDFMPYGASNFPYFYSEPFFSHEQTVNPEAYEVPPDEIWTACDIQFQVIGAVECESSRVEPNCDQGATIPVFWGEQAERDACIQDALEQSEVEGQPLVAAALKQALDALSPMYLEFGDGACPGFYGKAPIGGDECRSSTTRTE